MRSLRLLIVTAFLVALSGVVAPAAGADTDALIRAAHFSPDTPGVDVYLTSFAGGTTRLWVPDARYGGVSPYQRVPAGLYVVAMRPHGAPASSTPVISWNLDVKAGQVYTTAAIGARSRLRSVVLHDDLSLPRAGHGRFRLVQAASRAAEATVVAVDGPTIAADQPFASTTGYSTVPAGTWSLQASAAGSPTVRAAGQVSVPPGSVTSVLLLDAPSGGITIRTVLDAAAAGTVPVGPVPAGGGGTAPPPPGTTGGHLLALLGLLAAAAVSATALLARRRAPVTAR